MDLFRLFKEQWKISLVVFLHEFSFGLSEVWDLQFPQSVAQLIADISGSHEAVKFNTTALVAPAKESAFLLKGW